MRQTSILRLLGAGLLSVLLAGPTLADAPGMMPLKRPQTDAPAPRGPAERSAPRRAVSPAADTTVMNFGAANPTCQAWSNSCQICRRDEKGAVNCSTPGIACKPTRVVCRVHTGDAPVPAPAPDPSSGASPPAAPVPPAPPMSPAPTNR